MKAKNILLVFMCLIFLAGLGSFLYPIVNGFLLSKEQDATVQSFLTYRNSSAEETTPQSTEPVDSLRQAAEDYNRQLIEENQAGFNGITAYETPCLVLADYGMEEEIFGVVSIPSLEVELPIYLGASSENLSQGAAHMGQTSLPLGGENTNCVIAGHRGWRGADYFRKIPNLKPGDLVTVTNLWEQLDYQVMEVKTIFPRDSKALLIQPEQDLLTLLTCDYAPGGVKTRCLVICQRVSEE